MNAQALVRKTVDADPAAQPSAQVFLDPGGHVWHDMDFLYQTLSRHGLKRPKQQWRIDARKYWERAKVSTSLFHLRKHGDSVAIRSNVCRTSALYNLLWSMVAYGRRHAQLCGFVHTLMTTVTLRIKELVVHVPCAIAGQANFAHCPTLKVSDDGQRISGLLNVIAGLPRSLRNMMLDTWGCLVAKGTVADNLDDPEQNTADALAFLCFCPAFFKRRKVALGGQAKRFLEDLRADLFTWLANCYDLFLRHVYFVHHNTDKLAPSLTRPRGLKPYVQLTPEAVWEILQKSIRSGNSLSSTIEVCRDEEYAGCSTRNADSWMTKLHTLYSQRRAMGFQHINHLSLICDPARHSREDILATLCWSWETQNSAYGDVQALPEQRIVLPSESNLPPFLLEALNRTKQERVSSFRQLQGISNVVHTLTQGQRRGIWDFMPPVGFLWQPVQANETRGDFV